MTSTQLHTNTGSKPIISGTLSVVHGLEDVVSNAQRYIAEAIVEAIEEEHLNLKETLERHPDWADLVDDSEVSFSDEGVNYSVNADGAMDLEYGNPQRNIIATGALRSIAKRRSYTVSRSITEKFLKLAGRA
jgi:hypothetical protein